MLIAIIMEILCWSDKNLHFNADKPKNYARKCSPLDPIARR